ncbi:hypothetical protein [Nesterenkonia marinintestina]|uniref:hypothetical protein n=1 Tax=Nesterenkonia marinintestina TaxID=2979865 RepID=UPI0021BFA563|nr:hypothetical protein [Nesterenkonia sp. GX14115]
MTDVRTALRRRLGSVRDDAGSSIIEFVVLATVVMVPVVYLIVALSGLQSASYASVGAADQAAKMQAGGEATDDEADARAEAAVAAVLEDFDIDRSQAEVSIECPSGGCEQDGDLIMVTVDITVPVPVLSSIGGWDPTLATVSSTSAQVRTR